MKRWKEWSGRLRCLALAAALFLGISMALAAPAAALTSEETKPYLDKAVEWGVMRGDISGNLNPENNLTRAEFVAMVNRAFGFSQVGLTPFQDVPSTAWYAEDVGISYNMGYINGTSDTTFSPNSNLTREQAAVIVSRILMLQPQVGENTDFSDSREMANWSRGLLSTANDYNLLDGYPDGTFRPTAPMTRGEAATLLVKAIGNPIQSAGDYSLGDTWGNVTITASGVTLRDTVIGGNLYISEGVDLGEVTLENVKVLGEIVVSGGGVSEGGDDSIVLRNVDAAKLVVDNMDGQQVSLRMEGDGKIAETSVRTNAYISDQTPEGYGLEKITLEGEDGLELTVAGNIKEVIDATPKSTLNLASGTAQTITMDEKATDSQLNIAPGAQANKVNLDVGTEVTGGGDISDLNINASGSEVDMLPNQITIRPGVTADVGGETMDSQTAAEFSADPRLSAGYPRISDLAPTSVEAEFAANKKGTVYWAVTAITDGSVDADNLINPPSYNPLVVKQGSVSIGGSEQVQAANITGLTAGGSYYLSAVFVDGREQRSPVKVISFTTPDNTKPDFASGYPYMSKITSISGQVTTMTTKSCRLYWAVLPKGASAPTANDFKANAVTGNLGYGSIDVIKNTSNTFTVNSVPLEELKSYDLYLWLTDVDGAQSSAVKKLSFTTVDGTPPVFNTNPTVNSVKETSVGLYANLNEAGTLYWVVVKQGESYPKPIQGQGEVDLSSDAAKLQVAAGMNALKSGKVSMTANKDVSFNISGLDKESAYDLYYVAQDKAGNYSATVGKITIHTLDNTKPTVTQKFSKYNGEDETKPLPDSDVSLVFSEAVQTADNHVPLVDLYQEVAQAITKGDAGAEQDARDKMALALSKAIYLYQLPSNSQPVKLEGATDADKKSGDWVIDYRYAEIELDPDTGCTVVTFPSGEGINLKSGATYQFEIQANTIADTSSAINVMGRFPLDEFTTVFAQVNLSPRNESTITTYEDADGAQQTPTSPIPVDLSWRLSPVSTDKVDPSIDWDMLIWSDTSVEFNLYYRNTYQNPKPESDDGEQAQWKLLGSASITVPDGAEGYQGVSLTGDFLDKSSNPDFDALCDSLHEGADYEFAISFTKVTGITDMPPREGVWSQLINMKVNVVAGSNGDLGFLAGNITEDRWDDALDTGVTNIGLPADFSLRKQFTDNVAPEFSGQYPQFLVGDSAVEMYLRLDRPGTVYYVVAPITYVKTTGAGEDKIDYDKEENWQTLPNPEIGSDGEVTPGQKEPPALASPDYLEIVNASTHFASNDKIKYGKVTCGTGVEVERVEGLDKTQKYTVYFVIQGTSQTYSDVLAYRFTTKDVAKPKITLNNYNPSVNFKTDSSADLSYALVATTELPSSFNNPFENVVDPDLSEAWHAYIQKIDSSYDPSNPGTKYSVIWALYTRHTSGYSVFDEFAGDSIRDDMENFITGRTPLGATIATAGNLSLTQANRYQQEKNFDNNMTGGTVYYCLATAISPLGSDRSFAAVTNVQKKDSTPPTLQSVKTTIDGTTGGPDVMKYSGTVTFVFDEPVYQLVYQGSVAQTPMEVWQTQYTISPDDSKKGVNLADIIGSSSPDSFSCKGNIRQPSNTLTLTFTDIPLNTTLVLFSNSFICDSYGNSTLQNLTFNLETGVAIGNIQNGTGFVQQK